MSFTVSLAIKKFTPYLDTPKKKGNESLPKEWKYSKAYPKETLEKVRRGKEKGWIYDDDEVKPEVHFYLSDMENITSRKSYTVIKYENESDYSTEKNVLLRYHRSSKTVPTSLILCLKTYVWSLNYNERKSVPGSMQMYKKTAGFAWISLHHIWKRISKKGKSIHVDAELYEFVTYKKVLKGRVRLEFKRESFASEIKWIPSTTGLSSGARKSTGKIDGGALSVAKSVENKMQEMVMSGVSTYSKVRDDMDPPFSPMYDRILRIHAPTSTTDFFFAITSIFTLVLGAFLPTKEYIIHHLKVVLRREGWSVSDFNRAVNNEFESDSSEKARPQFHAACAIVIAACSLFASSTLYRSDYVPTSGRRRGKREIGEDYGYIEETFAGDCEDSAAANYRAIMMLIMMNPESIDKRKGEDYEMLMNAILVSRLYVPVLTLMEVTNPSFDKNAYKKMFKSKNYNAFPPMCHTVCITFPRKTFFDAIRRGSSTNEVFKSERAFFGGKDFVWEGDLHVLVSEGTAPTWPQQIPAPFYYGGDSETWMPVHTRNQQTLRFFRSMMDSKLEAFRLFKMTMLPDNYNWKAEGLDKRDLFYKQSLSRFYLTAVECYTGYPLIVSGDNFTEFLIVNPSERTYGAAFSDVLLMGRKGIDRSEKTTSQLGLHIKKRYNNDELMAIKRMTSMEIPLSTLELKENPSERREIEKRISSMLIKFNGRNAPSEDEVLKKLKTGKCHRATWYVPVSDFSALEETINGSNRERLSKSMESFTIERMEAKYIHIAANPHDENLTMNQVDVDIYYTTQ